MPTDDDVLPRLPDIPTAIRHLTTEQGRWVSQVFPRKHRSFCPTCRDAKTFLWYVPDSEGNTRNMDSVGEYACTCADQFLLNRRFLYAGIGEQFQTLDWDDFFDLDPDVVEILLDYIDRSEAYTQGGIGLTFWGKTRGTGKTLSGMLLAKALVGQGHDVFARTFSQLLDDMAAGWRDREDKVWFNARIRNATVLVIDDLGRERNKGEDSIGFNALEELMRHRASRSLSSIITTNEGPDQIEAKYGPHTVSLLSEQQMPVHFSRGLDRRPDANTRRLAESKRGIVRPVLL